MENCATDKERLALKKLRNNLQVLEIKSMNDMTLLRFLRARDLDAKKAEEMIKSSLAWRIEFEIESVANTWEPSFELIAGFDLYHCGMDFEGRPVFYAPLGNWTSAKDLFDKGQEEECLKYAAKSMEMVHKQLLTTCHQNFVCIVDIEGATYRKALHEIRNFKGIQDLIMLFREYESNFPETLHKAFVINTPSVFYWGFNIVKPLMTRRTLDKIQIFENSDIGWKSVLRNVIPENGIPEKLGGGSKITRFY